VYDEAWIRERSLLIQLAIDARRQKYGDVEECYTYAPLQAEKDTQQCKWDDNMQRLAGYWRKNIVI
jgi:hypothetical protein